MKNTLSLNLINNNGILYNIDNVIFNEENNIILFTYDNVEYIIDKNSQNPCFKRKNKEFEFELYFNTKECFYTLLETNTKLNIKVLVSDFKIEVNKILMTYKLETEEKENKIEIEIKEGD